MVGGGGLGWIAGWDRRNPAARLGFAAGVSADRTPPPQRGPGAGANRYGTGARRAGTRL